MSVSQVNPTLAITNRNTPEVRTTLRKSIVAQVVYAVSYTAAVVFWGAVISSVFLALFGIWVFSLSTLIGAGLVVSLFNMYLFTL
jgi:hypothetical protein